MWYLFCQIFIWLILTFLAGVLLGYWLCKKTSISTTPKATPKAKTSKKKTAKKKTSPKKVQRDDLQKIDGIGKVLEKKLNKLKIYSFEQVASFTKKDITKINKTLSFKGRIEREKWVQQAKKLVKTKK